MAGIAWHDMTWHGLAWHSGAALLTLIRFLLLAWCHAIQPPAFEESHITPLLWLVFHSHQFSVTDCVSDNCPDGWILLTDTSAPGMTFGIALLVNIPQLFLRLRFSKHFTASNCFYTSSTRLFRMILSSKNYSIVFNIWPSLAPFDKDSNVMDEPRGSQTWHLNIARIANAVTITLYSRVTM